ncbi:hypothetical protein [Ferrimonas pelagia]
MIPLNRPRLNALASLLILLSLCGCTINQYQMGQPIAQRSGISHSPTLTEVLTLLGAPVRLAATRSGYVLAWEHWQIREDDIGLSLRGTGADFLNFDWGQARVQGEFLLLTFDLDDRLSGQSFHQLDSKLGGGQSVQPLFSLVPVVDVSDLLNELPQHTWGAMSLDSLPQTLNHLQRIENGQLEQRGTPTGTGQRSLEML